MKTDFRTTTHAPILQKSLPVRPWAEEKTRRLPGLNPVAPGEWLLVDEAYAEQMRYRDELIETRRGDVHALAPEARPAAKELLETVLDEIARLPGFVLSEEAVLRPDGSSVPVDREDPLVTAARLVQEDLVVMQKPEGGAEHVLTGAVLCFPASWTLAEKFMQPLTAIHVPVGVYDAEIARRVQRLFDGLRAGRPIWRANFLPYADAELHQPRPENAHRPRPEGEAPFLRVERQVLLRLPVTQAVVFSIHTFVVRTASLSAEDRAAILQAR